MLYVLPNCIRTSKADHHLPLCMKAGPPCVDAACPCPGCLNRTCGAHSKGPQSNLASCRKWHVRGKMGGHNIHGSGPPFPDMPLQNRYRVRSNRMMHIFLNGSLIGEEAHSVCLGENESVTQAHATASCTHWRNRVSRGMVPSLAGCAHIFKIRAWGHCNGPLLS